MNAIEFLIRDHRVQEDLLCQLEASRPENNGEREEIFKRFREELIKHINLEEEIFYPRLKKITALQSKVLEALEEHNICMRLLQELDLQEADEKIWSAKISVLKELTRHHIQEEEEELFPQVQEMASEEFLQQMGGQMHFHKPKIDPEEVLYPDK